MKIGEDDRIVLTALLTANAVMGAVDTVSAEGCSRVIRSMDDPHAFVVIPGGYDWTEDADGIVGAMCSPDDAYAADPALSHGAVRLLAEVMAVPAAIAAGGLIARYDTVENRDTPECVSRTFAAYGRCLGELAAHRLIGMDGDANRHKTMFGPASPVNSKGIRPDGYRLPSSESGEFSGDGRQWFLDAVAVPILERAIPNPGRLSFNPDDGGIGIDTCPKTEDSPHMG